MQAESGLGQPAGVLESAGVQTALEQRPGRPAVEGVEADGAAEGFPRFRGSIGPSQRAAEGGLGGRVVRQEFGGRAVLHRIAGQFRQEFVSPG